MRIPGDQNGKGLREEALLKSGLVNRRMCILHWGRAARAKYALHACSGAEGEWWGVSKKLNQSEGYRQIMREIFLKTLLGRLSIIQ